ncbi:hypothetical protein Hanom_Chr02g00154561 [Helianthus anomalus]
MNNIIIQEEIISTREDASVCGSRIAPAVPIIIADVVIVGDYIFTASSTGSRLQFSTFEKYLIGLESWAARKLKSQSESSPQRSERGSGN